MSEARKLPGGPHEVSDDVSLRALLARIALADRTALAEFYDRTVSRVYHCARALASDDREAEQATEDVYLQVWRQAGAIARESGSAMAWLLTLTRHRALPVQDIGKTRARIRQAIHDSRDGGTAPPHDITTP